MPTRSASARAARLAAVCGLALGLLGAVASAAFAQTGGAAAPDGRKSFLNECSACHMAYPPMLLPRVSWEKILSNLSNHFGEDASLDPQTTQAIKAFVTSHSAETSRFGRQFMRGLQPGQTPLRITDMPVWISIHSEELPPSIWKDPRVRSKANCPACHHR